MCLPKPVKLLRQTVMMVNNARRKRIDGSAGVEGSINHDLPSRRSAP